MKRTLASEAPVFLLLVFIDSPTPLPGNVTKRAEERGGLPLYLYLPCSVPPLLCTSPAVLPVPVLNQ